MRNYWILISVNYNSLIKSIIENKITAMMYLLQLLTTAVIIGIAKYSVDTMTGFTTHKDFSANYPYMNQLVTNVITQMVILCFACLIRRYWLTYIVIFVGSFLSILILAPVVAISSPYHNEWIRVFRMMTTPSLTATIVWSYPVLFWALSYLFGLPRPLNKGWEIDKTA